MLPFYPFCAIELHRPEVLSRVHRTLCFLMRRLCAPHTAYYIVVWRMRNRKILQTPDELKPRAFVRLMCVWVCLLLVHCASSQSPFVLWQWTKCGTAELRPCSAYRPTTKWAQRIFFTSILPFCQTLTHTHTLLLFVTFLHYFFAVAVFFN